MSTGMPPASSPPTQPAPPSPGPVGATAVAADPAPTAAAAPEARVATFEEPGPARSWRHPSSWTLRTKIVASMLALFTVMTLVIAAASVVSLNRFLEGQLDDQLRSSLNRFAIEPDGDLQALPTDRRGPGDEGLVAVFRGNYVTYRIITPGGSLGTLTAAQADILRSAGVGRDAKDVDLGSGLGVYRVVSATNASSGTAGSGGNSNGTSSGSTSSTSSVATTVYVGLSRARQTDTVSNAFRTAILASLLGLLAVGIGAAWLVKRNLRPLTRVAETASRVSKLHLSSGEVALAERVPAEDTDPRTEVGQVGAALNELLDHVDQALTARHESEQRVRQFVADASHELRTPLASIRGYAELTRREREPVPESVTHALSRVESEATRMSSLVEDLLLLARLDAGRPLDQAEVDLSELVVNAVSDAHAASPEHKWRLDLPEEPVAVRGDAARLHQIVANLLANARVHTLPGTVVLTSISREPGKVRLTVQDNGPGVPPELQAKVFQRFSRGDTARTRSKGSTGLGLSIVAAVAGAHGGSVQLTSTPGNTSFSVLLPAPDNAASAPAWAGRVPS